MKKTFTILFLNILIFNFAQTLDPPKFSHESGFYDKDFNLELSHSDPNVKIVYTIDSSEPDINNLEGRTYKYKKQYPQYPHDTPFEFFENSLKSNLYLNSIEVYDRSNNENRISNISTTYKKDQYFPIEKLDKSFVVRAKAYKEDNSYSETITNVYFINKEYTLPIVSINTDEEVLFGYENGLFVAGKKFDEWRNENPTLDVDLWTPANYWNSGSKSEVKVNFIYFDKNKERVNQNVGVRNHGNGTRYLENRSYRFYAKKDYGKSDMSYNFFENYNYNSFKRLILRNSGSDTKLTMYRDAFVQNLNMHLNFETQNYQPVISFINGEYYGIVNLRERFDEKYFERVFGLKEKDIDFLENDGIVDLGDDEFYLYTLDFFNKKDLKDENNYLEAIKLIDEKNFIDYYIAEIFSSNYDWPQNNNEYFRKRVNYTADAKYAHDGRFRWVFKDLDVSFNGMRDWVDNSYRFNMLEHTLNNSINGTNFDNILFKGFLKNKTFEIEFVNRFSDLLNTSYQPQYMINLIDQMKKSLEPEMEKQINRWKLIGSLEDWNNNIEIMREFSRLRPHYQIEHLSEFFKLNGTYNLKTETNNISQGFVKVNTIEINNSTIGIGDDYQTWSGKYFQKVPLVVEAIALPGYKFSHWEGDISSTDQKITINSEKDVYVKAIFEKTLGVGDLDKVDFILFPNPVQDILNIASSSKSKIEYKISNIIGQIVEHNSTNNQKIDVSKLKQGVYIIQLTQDNKRTTKKFIKK